MKSGIRSCDMFMTAVLACFLAVCTRNANPPATGKPPSMNGQAVSDDGPMRSIPDSKEVAIGATVTWAGKAIGFLPEDYNRSKHYDCVSMICAVKMPIAQDGTPLYTDRWFPMFYAQSSLSLIPEKFPKGRPIIVSGVIVGRENQPHGISLPIVKVTSIALFDRVIASSPEHCADSAEISRNAAAGKKDPYAVACDKQGYYCKLVESYSE